MSTDVHVHHYTCSVYFSFFGMTCTKLQRPTCTKLQRPNYKDLPVTTTTSIPAHRCLCSWTYVFIFILSFWLTAKIYPSTFLLFYMSTDVPVYQYTCSVYFFLFSITCTITFHFISWHMYTQINTKVYLPVYFHASPLSNHEDLLVTTITCVPAHRCTRSWP